MENLVTEAFLLLNLLPLIHRVERWNILRGRKGRKEGGNNHSSQDSDLPS